jgi:hypothetical protein
MTKNIFLIAFTIAALATNAQDHSKTEAEIRRLEQIVVTAILNADTNRLKQVWSPEFLVNNPRNDISGNRDSVLLTQKAGMINYSSFERVIERMQFQKTLLLQWDMKLLYQETIFLVQELDKFTKDVSQIFG